MLINITLYCPKGNDTYRISGSHTDLDIWAEPKRSFWRGGGGEDSDNVL